MATSISIQENTVTTTSISVSFIVNVTYAGTYKIVYSIFGGKGAVDETYTSSNFTLPAGGSTSNPYKKFTGLSPGTRYKIECSLWNATTNTELGIWDSVYIYTDEEEVLYTLTIKYRDGSSSKTLSSDVGGYLTVRTSGLSSATIASGWTFEGWATTTSSIDIDYTGGEMLCASNSDETITLYAVYSKSMSSVTCYFGANKANNNTRRRTQWRVNSGTTSTTTKYTMYPSSLPTFNSSNLTVGSLTYSAIGWREDTTAGPADYSAGETLTSSEIGNLPTSIYAVYSKAVSISYNSNGGSGSMSPSTGTAYYNSYGYSLTATITLKSCSFTPPTGKSFNYWALGSPSGTKYESSILTSYDSTMYAVWKNQGPSEWHWSGVVTFNGKDHACPITSGGSVPVVKKSDTLYYAFYLNASEWNEFCSQINKLRNYHGLSNYSFSKATAGYEMQASQFNQAVQALNAIQSGIATPVAPEVSVKASSFIQLQTAFNSLV